MKISALMCSALTILHGSQKPLTAILTCCLYSVNSARTMGNQEDMSWRGKAGGTASFVRHTVLRLIYLKRMAPSLLRETGIWQSFFPPYLKQPEVWKFHLTPISFRKQDRAEKRQETERLIVQQRGVAEKASGEEGVNIIAALLGLGELVTNVNMPNQGQVSNLPIQAIVETNAFITRNRVQPILFQERFRKVWKCWRLGIYPIRRQWRTQV